MELKQLINVTRELVKDLGHHYPNNISTPFNIALQLFGERSEEELIELIKGTDFCIKDQKNKLKELRYCHRKLEDEYRAKILINNENSGFYKSINNMISKLGMFISDCEQFRKSLEIYEKRIKIEEINKKTPEEIIELCKNHAVKGAEIFNLIQE